MISSDLFNLPFVGTYELRAKLPLLLSRLQKDDNELVVTQKGKPKGIFLSIKKYLQMKLLIEELEEALRELKDQRYLRELAQAREEILSGKGQKAKDVFTELGI